MPTNNESYKKACIYKIWSTLTDKVYIGSTCDMTKRWCQHKSGYKSWKNGNSKFTSSFLLFDLVGVENSKMTWMHDFPCESKKELSREEGRVQIEHKDFIINRYTAGQTMSEYCEANKDRIKEQKKEYYEANKDNISEQKKEYCEANKDKISERDKEYYQANKDKIKVRKTLEVTCECGLTSTQNHLSRHKKSARHITLLNEMK